MAKVTKLKRKKKGDDDIGGIQEPLLPIPEFDTEEITERQFEVELSVTIKPEGGKGDKIVLMSTVARGTKVMPYLEYAVTEHRRNRAVIEAVLDNPSSEQLADAEQRRQDAQHQGEEAFG